MRSASSGGTAAVGAGTTNAASQLRVSTGATWPKRQVAPPLGVRMIGLRQSAQLSCSVSGVIVSVYLTTAGDARRPAGAQGGESGSPAGRPGRPHEAARAAPPRVT